MTFDNQGGTGFGAAIVQTAAILALSNQRPRLAPAPSISPIAAFEPSIDPGGGFFGVRRPWFPPQRFEFVEAYN